MAILGCVADDFTGAAGMASFLKKGGMRTLLLDGTPEEMQETDQADAIVIVLKTRTQETEKAVSLSLEALQWLKHQGCSHFYIKYCSTFDSEGKYWSGVRCCYGFFTGKKRFDLSCIAGKRKDSRTGQPVCEWYFAAGQFHERPSAYTDEGFQPEKTDGGAKPVFLPGNWNFFFGF